LMKAGSTMKRSVTGSLILLGVVLLNVLFVYISIISLSFMVFAVFLWWALAFVISGYVISAVIRWIRRNGNGPA
jgi:hypothetical protein